ncbi:MAG: hypothetical protein VXZ96_10100 [Myxococcota bacterium]|nr:hypothetical protein [Myxococcota bacterium]
MDDKSFQKKIVDFLDRADEIRERAEQSASLEEKEALFATVLSSMGLNEAEQAAMKEEGAADLEMAEHYFDRAQYEECEVKASRAHQLLPFAEKPIVLLLQLHQRGKLRHTAQVPKLKSELLQLNPEHSVFNNPDLNSKDSTLLMRYGLIFSVSLILFGMMLLSFAAVVAFYIFDEPAPQEESHESIQSEDVESINLPAEVNVASSAPDDQFEIKVSGMLETGLSIQNRGTDINRLQSSYSVLVKAVLNNNSTAAVKTFDFELALMDGKGDVILKRNKSLFLESEAPLQPNIETGFEQFFYIDTPELLSRKPDHVLITVKSTALVDSVQIPIKAMALDWDEGLVVRPELTIHLEQHPPQYSKLLDSWYYRSALRINYEGRYPIRKLKLKMDAFDGVGNLIRSDDFIVTYGRFPEIVPNQSRLYQRFLEAKQKPEQFKITVLEME